jgi:hypothetical protein
MMATLTEEEFSQHVNTDFNLKLEAPEPIELRLVEVKGYAKKAEEHQGMERFSAFFTGPAKYRLPQGTYTLSHEGMGEFDIFLVPVSQNANGFRYEAVFNYFVQAP